MFANIQYRHHQQRPAGRGSRPSAPDQPRVGRRQHHRVALGGFKVATSSSPRTPAQQKHNLQACTGCSICPRSSFGCAALATCNCDLAPLRNQTRNPDLDGRRAGAEYQPCCSCCGSVWATLLAMRYPADRCADHNSCVAIACQRHQEEAEAEARNRNLELINSVSKLRIALPTPAAWWAERYQQVVKRKLTGHQRSNRSITTEHRAQSWHFDDLHHDPEIVGRGSVITAVVTQHPDNNSASLPRSTFIRHRRTGRAFCRGI